MKTKMLIASIMLVALACKKNNVNPPKDDPKTGVEEPVSYNENSDRGILKGYSSFEVDVPSNVIPITEIVKGTYTKPNSAYGFASYIDFRLNTDNSADVFWINSQKMNISRISLGSKTLVKNFTLPQSVQLVGDERFLGFESLGNDTFVTGRSTASDPADGKIKDIYYTSFNGNSGEIKYTTKMWSDPSITYYDWVGEKNAPGQASTPVLKYNKYKDALGVYLGHHKYNGHQGGFLAFIKASTGEIITKTSNGKKTLIGSEWFYSHNFDQRLLVSNVGNHEFYSLSHGDSYPRAMGLNKWSEVSGQIPGELLYLKDMTGDGNATNSRTGDLLELPNGDVAILYATSVGRAITDAKIVIVSGMNTDKPVVKKETWLTANTVASGEGVGWGMQLGLYGDGTKEILVGWNTYKSNTPVKTSFALVDFNGNITSKTEDLPTAVLYHAQSMAKTSDNKLVFISTGASANKLKVNVLEKK